MGAIAGTAWILGSLEVAEARAPSPLATPPTVHTFKLDDPSLGSLTLLRAFQDAAVERPGPYGRYVGGPWGQWRDAPWMSLTWRDPGEPAPDAMSAPPPPDAATSTPDAKTSDAIEAEDDGASDRQTWISFDPQNQRNPIFGFPRAPGARFEVRVDANAWLTRLISDGDDPLFETTGPSLTSNGFDVLWAPPPKPVIDWRCRRRPVQFVRYGGENDAIALLRCNGAVEPGALDRMSVLLRPTDVAHPGVLPDEPDPDAWIHGEWVPRVKLVHPRVMWLLQKIADAFPRRAIYVFSGYRPNRDKGDGHHSKHGEGRAVDLQVYGIPNEKLFQLCRKLDDVGCGFYPNSKFVHVDVRAPGTGHALWVDASGPGEPSRYVDGWPGVIEKGVVGWIHTPDAGPADKRGPTAGEDRGSADVVRK